MFVIMGKYKGSTTEEIDIVDSESEAKNLVSEYRMAFGVGWVLWYVYR